MSRPIRAIVLTILLIGGPSTLFAQAPISYRLSVPDRVHRLLDVDVTFPDLPAGPLRLRMSRSSPGRYAIHQFAKNVFDVRITDAAGTPLPVTRTNVRGWDVQVHPSTVRVRYRVFGDRIDGTYLAVDATHLHLNMPAALMWAEGLDRRAAMVHFDGPAEWRVATQLFPGADARTFTAPNLQYLMDSPTEFSAMSVGTFTIADGARTPTFRLTIHHQDLDTPIDNGLLGDVEKLLREERAVFGEFPAYEGNTYTFLADYLPWASGDGMEHRNSTVLTTPGSLREGRADLIGLIAHEFFHCWNVERIRPAGIEPFNFEDANITGGLWLAEGFTNYYGPLALVRSELSTVGDFARDLGRAINTVIVSPGRTVRTAEQMSEFAPFVDAATAIDRTDFENTFISYYTWGSAIGIGLDLTLRDRTDGRVTLDDFMRELWRTYGKPGGHLPGYVDHPYTMAGLQRALARVSGDAPFAADFFRRFVQGHDVVDYARLLGRAGLLLRPASPGRGFAGTLRLQDSPEGPRIAAPVPVDSPAYQAGLERDARIVSVAGAPMTSARDVMQAIEMHKPGDALPVVFELRGATISTTLRLADDPRVQLVPAEDAGQSLTAAQQRFRKAWLSSARTDR